MLSVHQCEGWSIDLALKPSEWIVWCLMDENPVNGVEHVGMLLIMSEWDALWTKMSGYGVMWSDD